jgi:hypothetical protein
MTDYDHDFYAWTKEQAALIRTSKDGKLDRHNISKEIEFSGQLRERQCFSWFISLIASLLHIKFSRPSPEAEGKLEWIKSDIKLERLEVLSCISESPSLKKSLEKNFKESYVSATLREPGVLMLSEDYPRHCPFSLEQILDENFFAE